MIQNIINILSVTINVFFFYRLTVFEKKFNEAQHLISEETKRKESHTKAFEDLVNPDKIDSELERSARLHEAWNAKRTSMPREDAGPPAVIHAPKKNRSGRSSRGGIVIPWSQKNQKK